MKYIDAHLHLTDPRMAGKDLPNAEALFSCTASKDEWDALLALSNDDGRIAPFFGTHPWYPQGHDGQTLRDILERNPNAGVGEIGLDGTRPDMESQREIFLDQLDAAAEYGRTASIHSVRCDEEMLRIVRRTEAVCIMHSFSGPESYVRPMTDAGCYFSVSPRILKKSESKILALINAISDERLLIETDAPDGGMHMEEFIDRLSAILGTAPEALADMTARNARSLIP